MRVKERKLFKAALPLILLAVMCTCMALAVPGTGGIPRVHAEGDTGDGTVSGNDEENKVCTCTDKCGAYDYDKSCAVCAADYKACAYKVPNVVINITVPSGWYRDSVSVACSVSDILHTGNFELASMQAKIGQNGSWSDITEDKKLSITENCTVYVLVTDQNGKTYEKNKKVACFDTVKPTLNAAVSDGLLTVQAQDMDSGIKAVYVNGYKFTDLTNGVLNIRLQQFDAGYENFTLYAMDYAGNVSDVYKTKNPYYKEQTDESDENPAAQLPVSAEASLPGSATAEVTEHVKTDSSGNTVEEEKTGQGKEFYTIETSTEKVFYLIIDRDGEEEKVYFLTEITENDLLNTTSDNSGTLPKNSAALESAVPAEESALPNNNGDVSGEPENKEENMEETGGEDNTEDTEKKEEQAEEAETNPVIPYALMGIFAVLFIGAAYYFMIVRKRKEGFVEDEEEEDEEDGEEEYEDDTPEDPDDGFFNEET